MARVMTANGSVHLDTCGLVRGEVTPTRKPLSCKRDIKRAGTVDNSVRTMANGTKVAVVTAEKPVKAAKKAAKVASAAARNTSKTDVVVIDVPKPIHPKKGAKKVAKPVVTDYSVSAQVGLDNLLSTVAVALSGAIDMLELAPDALFNEEDASTLATVSEIIQNMRTQRQK